MTRTIWHWLLLLILASHVVMAEEKKPAQDDTEKKVYRSVGPSGEVIFSDQPSKGAQEIEVSPSNDNTYQPVPAPAFTPYTPPRQQEQADKINYTQFYVSSPANEETLWADTGEVNIQLMIEPALQPGHELVYVLDGQKTAHNGLSLLQTNVPRGEHKVNVEIHDNAGNVVMTTPTVTFYVRRPTVKK